MKIKTLFLAGIFFMLPFTALAIEPPVLDEIPDAVDATTLLIKGSATAGAKVTVVGGPSEVVPVVADADGRFSIKVGLAQETVNTFAITVSKDGEISESREVVVTEGKEAAMEYQETFGRDVIAPDAPTIDPYTSPVNAEVLILTGRAEANSTVEAFLPNNTTIGTAQANENGIFSICISLESNSENVINFSAMDDAGNVSVIVQETIVTDETATRIHVDERKCVAASIEGAEVAPPFTDIEGHWAASYIEKLRLKGVISGKKPGIFDPDGTITRAELLKIALRAFGIETANPETAPFPDVELYEWYTEYVAIAKVRKFVEGYADGTFRPNHNVSRAEALKILLSISGLTIDSEKGYYFPDVDVEAWYSKYIAFALDNVIVAGYADGNFRPHDPITRAQVVKLAALILDLMEQPEEEQEDVKDDTKDDTTNEATTEEEDTGTGSVASGDTQEYYNAFFKIRFSLNASWFYNWPGGIGEALATIYLSEKNPQEEGFDEETDNLITVNIMKKGLEEIEILDGAEVTEGDTFKIFKVYDNDNHVQIYGSIEHKAEIQRVAATLETGAEGEETSEEEEEEEESEPDTGTGSSPDTGTGSNPDTGTGSNPDTGTGSGTGSGV